MAGDCSKSLVNYKARPKSRPEGGTKVTKQEKDLNWEAYIKHLEKTEVVEQILDELEDERQN